MKNNQFINFKIVVVGDRLVGKSSFIQKYLRPDFPVEQIKVSTVGADLRFKTIYDTSTPIKLVIHDTTGDSRFTRSIKSYYKGAQGVIIIYDLINDTSLESVFQYLKDVNEFCLEKISVLILGNKSDIVGKDIFQIMENNENLLKQKLQETKINHWKHKITSTISNTNIQESWNTMICMALRQQNQQEIFEEFQSTLQNSQMFFLSGLQIDNTNQPLKRQFCRC